MTRPLIVALMATSALLTACAVGPNYKTPTAPAETAFKEANGWTPSQPMDALDRGDWWSAFNDPVLDGLEKRVSVSNQTLLAQEAAYQQASAALAQSQASFFPTLGADASGSKSRSSVQGAQIKTTSYSAGLSAAWSPDLWGRVRRQIEAARANAQLSAADLANLRLSLQAALASDYFELRATDELNTLLTSTVANYQRALQLTQNQYDAGTAARADVISARTQLENAQASLVDLRQQRAQLEHAIALLVGETPANFSLAPAPLAQGAPSAPLNLASTLLQRRPDVAAAERAVEAASAGIGVAMAAYFPSLSLSGSDSSTASKVANLFKAGSNSWAYGASATETLIDFGARRAQVRGAKGLYRQRLAEYRETVLAAFGNVEDQIAALRTLEDEVRLRDAALSDARQAESVTMNQYRSGIIGFSAVILAQNTSLTAAQSRVATQKARLLASVGLIQALGGGWTRKDLPAG